MYYRTHNCGELSEKHIGKEVRLSGWIATLRNLGSIIFIDLRDRYGITQLYIDSQRLPEGYKIGSKLSRESVIMVLGVVRPRAKANEKITTGNIELEIKKIQVLSAASELPFIPNHDTNTKDELKMQYRYLNLREYKLQQNLEIRHKAALLTRNYLSNLGFYEIETPFLIKSTPEGARDFLVPSRLYAGKFYALPQSPQMFKQLLMVSGFDKYFQIVRCFRDEDFRSDRQPEFTQIDCEMSFVTQENVMEMFESYIRHLFKVVKDVDLPEFKILSYSEAIKKYGSDKPDLRFDMQIVNVTNAIDKSKFELFADVEELLAIPVKNAASLTRKQLDSLKHFIQSQQVQAKGFVFCAKTADKGLKTALAKFYNDEELTILSDKLQIEAGDAAFIMYGDSHNLYAQAGMLRVELAKILDLINNDTYAPLWVVDFPLFEKTLEGQFKSMHHPFTSPQKEDMHLLDSDPSNVRGRCL
ncbi:MAG: aspartate--tRNA ligase [Solitalea-like symbiont of Acarus siro]